ncbi:hypothetical protein DWQ65_01325 [Treponema phagedenis]|uniref:P83100 family protein n=1 Tax=Treponema phagedenis TaxID=162 RepID=A0A0B7GVL0_TREPH|nr:P83/100 family protein [Treponema phagedenis]QEJ94060.1 hypothetical protein FUT79_01735 [Treponema phagedenis]QEK02670.1 hypothetical protein FUT83_01845 [Treponema phagedenis]QEK08297.1 hypothetical protein FUT81_01825 [Treponema phagedenis]QSH98733.1 hypothetical protein DWQ65_01325 [Treponema phagedenis]CEM62513.1 conserved exported hypothetical protein [Treponema phagedenis]
MKKLLFFCVLSFLWFGFAIEVDQAEVERNGNKVIEFINYTGPHAETDTAEAIRAIGRGLSSAVKYGSVGETARYYIIHAVDEKETTGFDADIFIIGANARVDHIDNIRLIIASYLSTAYGYSARDAATLANFITVYNAVYRNDMNNFQNRYKQVVTKHLSANTVGIALRYDQWPGQTQIVIPLSDAKYSGSLSTIDTTTITDKKVVEKMREDKDKNIDTRKDMIDLKERESAESQERAKEQQKEANAATKDAKKQQKEAEAKKAEAKVKQQEAKKAQKEAEQAEKKAKENPEDKKAQKEAEVKKAKAEAKQQEAEAAEKEAEEKQQEAKEAQEAAAKKQEEATQEQKRAEKKAEEAQDERKGVASDTQKIIEEERKDKEAAEDAALEGTLPGYGLKVIDEKQMLSEIVMLDLKTEKQLKVSPLNTVRGRSLYEEGDSLIAIAGTTGGNGVISLVQINTKTLEIIKQSKEQIAAQSILLQKDRDYYAVVNQNGKYYLGRFNDNLELLAKSAIQVLPFTAVTVSERGIIIQDISSAMRLLKPGDLTLVIKE